MSAAPRFRCDPAKLMGALSGMVALGEGKRHHVGCLRLASELQNTIGARTDCAPREQHDFFERSGYE